MDKQHEKEYHELEGTNWWYVSRRRIIASIMKNIGANRSAKILDIGCSGGEMILELKNSNYKNVFGIDVSADAINLCKSKGIKNAFLGNAEKMKFKSGEFDLIIASDVLEHFRNDYSAAKEWARVLKPSGKLIIFVPAFEILWSNHDVEAHHFRRYSSKAFRKVLENSGFKIEKFGYWNFAIFLPLLILRIIKNSKILRLKSNDIYELPNFFNGILLAWMDLENAAILKGIPFPFGVSLFAVASKK